MDKEKFLLRLNLEIDTLKAHVNRLKPAGYNIHPLDMELLRKKATELYDLMLQFEMKPDQKTDIHKDPPTIPIDKKENQTSTVVHEEIPRKVEKTIEEHKETPPLEVEKTIADDVFIRKEEETDILPEPKFEEPVIQTPIEKPVVEPPVVEKKLEANIEFDISEKKTEPVLTSIEKPVPPKVEPIKTTLDLFSTVSDNMLANKLTESGTDNSLAGRIQKERLQNIRSAIGINEKFLFVNEIFKGDLSRYNRVIDELNAMQTKQGADTYLMELKIEGQFGNDHQAFEKLKEIVGRKY